MEGEGGGEERINDSAVFSIEKLLLPARPVKCACTLKVWCAVVVVYSTEVVTVHPAEQTVIWYGWVHSKALPQCVLLVLRPEQSFSCTFFRSGYE